METSIQFDSKMKYLTDIMNQKDDIIEFVLKHPETDIVLIFDGLQHQLVENEKKQEHTDEPSQLCIAGSSLLPELVALAGLCTKIKVDITKLKPKDTDVFCLGSKVPKHRLKSIVNVDLVEVPDKNPIDLLLGFDLPCCRVATDSDMKWYVSLQCLYALFTGQYPLPSYLKEQKCFINTADHLPEKVAELYHHRFLQRVKKYETRGFNPQWITMKEKCEWIKRRVFFYSDLFCRDL